MLHTFKLYPPQLVRRQTLVKILSVHAQRCTRQMRTSSLLAGSRSEATPPTVSSMTSMRRASPVALASNCASSASHAAPNRAPCSAGPLDAPDAPGPPDAPDETGPPDAPDAPGPLDAPGPPDAPDASGPPDAQDAPDPPGSPGSLAPTSGTPGRAGVASCYTIRL